MLVPYWVVWVWIGYCAVASLLIVKNWGQRNDPWDMVGRITWWPLTLVLELLWLWRQKRWEREQARADALIAELDKKEADGG
jgi:hypothetical protein